jgi:hypothetical protein
MAQPPVPAQYRITIQGHLDKSWAEWMENMTITHDRRGNTILVGPVVDQAALRGILCRVWDLNLTLISIVRTRR